MTNKRKKSNQYVNELGSTITLAGAGTLATWYFFPEEFFENLRDAISLGRHAGLTAYEVARGGSEGMRAAKNLEEAIAIVEGAASQNTDARDALEGYLAERRDLVGELAGVYKENETLSRESERLQLQLEGMIENLFTAGNSLKPGFMTKIDDAIIKIYGQDPVEARERSARLDEFYSSVKEFYDSREKNENTVQQFCDYLAKVKTESLTQNQRFNELFPTVIKAVREGYETEDIVLNTGDKNILGMRKDVQPGELEMLEERVENYSNTADETENTVASEMPIERYSPPTWIDYAVNPLALGIAGALVVKGISKVFVPGIVERPIRKALALPFTLAAKGAYGGGKAIYNGVRKIINKNNRHQGSDQIVERTEDLNNGGDYQI